MRKILLKGLSASPGIAKGTIRILMDPSECKYFKKNEILVTEMTDPRFMPALKIAKAVITDIGGLLCHAAITSRELGIPCIVNAKNASSKLKNGQRIVVDAVKGQVYEE